MGTTSGPGAQVAANLAAVRRRRGMTVRGLSERLDALGAPLLPSGITKIEQGQRGVSVDELVALCAALNVSPARLLLPDAFDPLIPAALTDRVSVPSDRAWQWAQGGGSLGLGPSGEDPVDRTRDELMEDVVAFLQERPTKLRFTEEHPAVRDVKRLAVDVDGLVGRHLRGWANEEQRAISLQLARSALERVRTQIEAIDRESADGER